MSTAKMKQAIPALALLLTVSLSGCDTAPSPPLTDGATTELPNPLKVSTVRVSHMLRYAPGGVIPDTAEVAGLNMFLTANQVAQGDSVLAERAAPIGPAAIALDDKRTARLAAALGRQSVKTAMAFEPAVPAGQIRLTVDHVVASAPNCPNWSKAPGNDFGNTMHSDFGCASASNLAAMVDDPRDLAGGRTMGPGKGDAALQAMHKYRTGKVASLSGEDTGSGLVLPSMSSAPPSPAQ
jgi:pilus assembly protein CpaD